MAEVQDAGNTNLLKRPLPDTEDVGLKKQRIVDGVETDNSGDTAVVLQELDEIGADIHEILATAEREKERIARESAEAVQKRLQDRARVVEQLPGFWGVALRQSLARDYITEDDDKLLEHLESIDVAEVDNLLHITLRFTEENPYLETTEITRLVVPYDASVTGEVSAVAWKPGQELSPATDDSGHGTFDSCNFFQRITCVDTFDTVDQILHDIFWDPMKYYNGTVDLAAERLSHQFVEEVEDDEGDDEQPEEEAVLEEGLEQELQQDQAAGQEEAGSSDEDLGSDGEDAEDELNVEDQEVEEEDEEDADVDGDDGDAL